MAGSTGLAAVVSALKVTRVLVMDEAHEPTLDSVLPDLMARRTSLQGDDLELFVGLNLQEVEDDVFRHDADRWWAQVPVGRRREVVARFGEAAEEGEHPSDSKTYGTLWDCWPKDTCIPEFLTPEEWDEGWRSIFSDDGTKIAILDLKLGDDEEGGARRMRDLFDLSPPGRCIAVIFTNEVEPDDEAALWNRLAESHRIPTNYGMVVSKKRMSSEADFAQHMARAAMTSTAREVADLVARRYDTLTNEARGRFRDILDGNMFRHIVVATSTNEGVHPQDTLFRLVDLFLRRERQTHRLAISTELAEHVAILNALADLSGDAEPLDRAKALRSDELYTDYFGTGATTLPPWLGDIWEITTNRRSCLYIHLGHPCDLLLRKDGGRAASYFLFAPLNQGPLPPECTLVGAPVPYLRIDDRVHDYWAGFKKVVVVDADLLDAVAIGGPEFSVRRFEEPSDHILPGVQARHVAALGALKDSFQSALGSGPDAKQQTPRLLMTGRDRESWIQNDNVIRIEARRVLRLEGSHAMEVLHRYAWSLQRAAHDPNFAQSAKPKAR